MVATSNSEKNELSCHNFQCIPIGTYLVLFISSSPPVDQSGHTLALNTKAAHSSEMLVHTIESLCHSPDHHNPTMECYSDFQYYIEYVPTQLNGTFL